MRVYAHATYMCNIYNYVAVTSDQGLTGCTPHILALSFWFCNKIFTSAIVSCVIVVH